MKEDHKQISTQTTSSPKVTIVIIPPKNERTARENSLFAIDQAVELLYRASTDDDYTLVHRALSFVNTIRSQLTGRLLSEAVEIYAPQLCEDVRAIVKDVGRNELDDREDAHLEELALKKAETEAKAKAAAAAAAEVSSQSARARGALVQVHSKDAKDSTTHTGKLTPKQQKKKEEEERKAARDRPQPQRVHRLPPSRYPPEVAAFFRLLLVYLALDRGHTQRGLELLRIFLDSIYSAQPNALPLAMRRSFDALAARARSLQALAAERRSRELGVDTLTPLREELLPAFTRAVRALHEQTQAVLWTAIARSFVLQRRYAQAQSFVAQAPFPQLDRVPAPICARHLYYTGLVACTQLRYADAVEALSHAYRKAPTRGSVGFRQALVKALVCAQLSVGTLPARTLFTQARVSAGLAPYQALTNCVRRGDVRGFMRLMGDHKAVAFFRADGLLSVVQRLKESVLRAGLRRIVQCYAQIPLAAVAERLAVDNLLDAETVVLKGIHDGVIDAQLDLNSKVLTASRKVALASCAVPRDALLKRVSYCLELRDQIATNMRFPAPNYNELNV